MFDESGIDEHRRVMYGVIEALNSRRNNPFVLKGGTSLMRCYGLDRFSEDVDLDGPGEMLDKDSVIDVVASWADGNGVSYRIDENTDTVKKVFLHYAGEDSPLNVKVEASFRRQRIPDEIVETRDGIRVYTLSELCLQKCSAYQTRDKVRDLYDVTWLCSKRYEELNTAAREALFHAFEYKDLDQFDYIISSDEDPLIDTDVLATRFLESFEKVGLMSPSPAGNRKPASVPPVPTPNPPELESLAAGIEIAGKSAEGQAKARNRAMPQHGHSGASRQ